MIQLLTKRNCPKCGFHAGNLTKGDMIRCCKCLNEVPAPEKKKKKETI